MLQKIAHTSFSTYYFFQIWFLCTGYAIVLDMTSSYVTELRNVDWELYLLYSEGLVKPERESFLWAEVDRLEALIALESRWLTGFFLIIGV